MSKSLEDFMSGNDLTSSYSTQTSNLGILSYKLNDSNHLLNGFKSSGS
jgi:hypothetical protein